MSRRIWLILSLVLAALIIAACVAPTAPAGAGGEAPAPQREIVWMVRTAPPENPWEQDVIIPAFEKEHPDIKVNLQIIDSAYVAVKREAMIAAGEQLDVWSPNWGGDGFASDRARGLLTDLTPLIERDHLDMSVFDPDVLALYNTDGKQWGLPFLTTGSYVFYNMGLFDAAGLQYPPTSWEDKNWTWDAMVNLAKQLTKNYDDPPNATYGLYQRLQNIEGPAMIFGEFPWPAGAYETGFADGVDLTSPGIVAAYQKYRDLIHLQHVMPDSAATDALGTLGTVFETGRVAMIQNGGWGWWQYSLISPDVEGGFAGAWRRFPGVLRTRKREPYSTLTLGSSPGACKGKNWRTLGPS